MIPATPYEVDRWNVNGKQILLFCQDDETSTKLEYKIEAEQPNAVEIPSRLYSSIDRICGVVSLFHDVIEANLNHIIEPSSFIPVLESTAQIKQQERYIPVRHLKVALFGRGDFSTKTLHEAHWGILDQRDNSTKRVVVQKIEGDLQECLINVLCNRYCVSLYADHRIEVSLDSDGQVQSLALTILSRPSFYSIFDKSVPLDENHWAVTLVSTPQGFSWRWISAGHAVIACEGVNEGRQFLEYVHITKNPEKEDTTKFAGGAQVEIIKKVSSKSRNGPTWRRPRTAVENMLLSIRKADQARQRVSFALGKNIYKIAYSTSGVFLGASLIMALYYKQHLTAFYDKYGSLIRYSESITPYFSFFHQFRCSINSLRYTAYPTLQYTLGIPQPMSLMLEYSIKTLQVFTALMIATFSGTSAYTSKRLSDRYDCLSWSVEQLQKAGVHFQLPLSIITPNGAVEYVNKHLDKIVFKDS